mgnify:CR=1 FL=1
MVVQIAKRIKELREVLEMSVEDVSMQLGVCIEDYQRYEEGKDDIPVGVLYGAAALFQEGGGTADSQLNVGHPGVEVKAVPLLQDKFMVPQKNFYRALL